MTRYALLFGNTDGLNGVKPDIARVSSFLQSGIGGAWNPEEINIGYNIGARTIRSILSRIKREKFDYVVVYFSGHGGMQRTTNLYLNEKDEYINEQELYGLASRQLMIFDCCRCFPHQVENSKIAAFDAVVESSIETRRIYRKRYERLILESTQQEICLYACQPGGIAYDTPDGGVYTNQLISGAIAISESRDGDVFEAHRFAARMLKYQSMMKGQYQEPSAGVRCTTKLKQYPVFCVQKIGCI